MTRIPIKPMSVNMAWKGQRFKTKEYKWYEQACMLLMPKGVDIPEGELSVYYEFGVSNAGADYDNPIKPIQDILQKRYNFNDSRIVEAHIRKVKVKKGEEYIIFKFSAFVQ